MMDELRVLEIERFAIHDGPGIRTTIFLQGCPLHCPWCANPESQPMTPQLLYQAQRCQKCFRCVQACPNGCIRVTAGALQIDRTRCEGCGACQRACVADALRVLPQPMTVDEIVREVQKDEAYYQTSGGGVTISGGEAFVQFEGLMKLLEALHAHGFHICIETTGMTDPAHLKQADPYIDHYLWDMKSADRDHLLAITGAMLDPIIDHMRLIAPEKITVRVPVIPGFNDSETELRQIFHTTRSLGIRDLHLLPYHRMGIGKYEQLGRAYPWNDAPALHAGELEPFRAIAEQEFGLLCRIGG